MGLRRLIGACLALMCFSGFAAERTVTLLSDVPSLKRACLLGMEPTKNLESQQGFIHCTAFIAATLDAAVVVSTGLEGSLKEDNVTLPATSQLHFSMFATPFCIKKGMPTSELLNRIAKRLLTIDAPVPTATLLVVLAAGSEFPCVRK